MADFSIFGANSLTGGGDGDLDAIDGATLDDGDMAYVIDAVNDRFYAYTLNASSGAAESSPSVIEPDNNAGTKRWILVALYGTSGSLSGNLSVTGTLDAGASTLAATTVDDLVFSAGGTTVDIVRDEDTMSSDDVNALATQQSIKAYVDTEVSAGALESVPTGEIILFEKDTAVTGYTLKTDKDDYVVYITKGSVAGGENGATDKSGGTWTQPNHLHSTSGHTLSESEMPAHNHITAYAGAATGGGGSYGSNTDAVGFSRFALLNSGTPVDNPLTSTEGSGSSHTHGNTGNSATANTWRPVGRNFTRQERN
jgi:hypothetical protein